MNAFTTRTTRRAHLAALGGLGAALFAACAGPGNEPAVAPTDVKGTTVEYLGMFAPTHPEEVARTKVLEDFNARNTLGVRVNVAATAGQTAATMDQVISALAGGTPPDMVNSFHFNMSLFAARGATVDVDAELKGSAEWKKIRPTIYPHIVSGLTWKERLFAVPSHNSSLLLYWHSNLLTRAGLQPPPKTWSWDQFVDYCKKASQPPEITGYDEAWSYRRTGLMVLNAGVQPISKDGTKLQLNSPDFVQVIEFLVGLTRQGLSRAHNGSASGGYSEKLPDGTVVFQVAVPNRVIEYRQKGFTEFGTGYFPIGPKNTSKTNYSHGTPYGWTVFKGGNTRKVQAALQAALWSARLESGKTFTAAGGVRPSYRSIVDDPSFQAEYKSDAQTWPFFEVLPNFLPFPNFPTFPEAEPLIDAQLKNIWAGKATAKEGMDEAQRQAQRLLDQAQAGG